MSSVKSRVLVVEDNTETRAALRDALEELGYDVVEAGQACVAAAVHDFDVALLDIHLPDGDGLSVLKHWRELGLDAPVLVLTDDRGAHAIDRALNALDAWDYLPKPFDFGQLERSLADVLTRSRERRSIERRLAG